MSRKKKQLRFHSVVLVIILAAVLSLRLYRLDYQSLWYDEIKNISLAKEFSLKEFSSGEHASTQPVFFLFFLLFAGGVLLWVGRHLFLSAFFFFAFLPWV